MRKNLVFVALCALYFASLFVPAFRSGSVIMLALLSAYTLFSLGVREKISLLRQRPAVMLMLAFAAWILLSYLWSQTTKDGLRPLTLRLPLLILPFTLGLFRMDPKLRNRILLILASILTVALLISFAWAVHQYRVTGLEYWLYNDSISLLIGQQSIYTSLLVNISVFIFLHSLGTGQHDRPVRVVLCLAIVILLGLSYLLASRNMMVFLFGSLLLYILVYLFHRRQYLRGALFLGSLGILVATALMLFPDTINRFRELRYTDYQYGSAGIESHYAGELTPDQWNGANFRLAAWSCGWQLFTENPVIGTGMGDKRDQLYRIYKERDFKFALRNGRNVHNNYLDMAFSLGLIGLVLFLAGWLILPLRMFFQSGDTLALLITACFAFAMVTENYFDRSLGPLLFGFFICFLVAGNNHRREVRQ